MHRLRQWLAEPGTVDLLGVVVMLIVVVVLGVTGVVRW